MSRVILRPLNKESWSGVIKYKNCYEAIGPYFTRSGRYYTGLTMADEERLGNILNLDLRSNSEFWSTFRIKSYGKDIYLDVSDEMDELKYLFLKSHKLVASNIADRKATARFVLINQENEAKEVNTFNKLKRNAIKEFDKLTHDEMKRCLRIYGHNADMMSNEIAEKTLFDIIEGDPEKFLEKWVRNESKETEFLIKNAVGKNILRKNKTMYKYGTDVIGHTMEEAIAYIDDPNNRDLKIAILKEIEAKK
jgi:hypothetical protein